MLKITAILFIKDELGNINKFLPDLELDDIKIQIERINDFLIKNKNFIDDIVLNSWKPC